ncbi:PIN domain-containing protein [Paenibacillus sp. WLX1005]|uniref:PIN domain-containing protein n=1 Tax=Paenibacillus sp. WLX1005 TaxID=3243766 RepID=UPI0039842769
MKANSSKHVVALLDTTVLCGAIRNDGINRRLLLLAADYCSFKPVLSRVCLMEFYQKALYDGIAGVVYPLHIVEQFLDYFIYPILEDLPAVNSQVGRHHWEIVKRQHTDVGQALAELSGFTTEQAVALAKQMGVGNSLSLYDPQDVHVWVTALRQQCHYIVTSNTQRFPQQIGTIIRIRPGEFYNYLL